MLVEGINLLGNKVILIQYFLNINKKILGNKVIDVQKNINILIYSHTLKHLVLEKTTL